MSGRCGYAIADGDGAQQPCDRPAIGWRWYQDCEHEDSLDVACEWHENPGGELIAQALADERALSRIEALADEWLEAADALTPADDWGESIEATIRADFLREKAASLREALEATQ